jgi:hypothetical protein
MRFFIVSPPSGRTGGLEALHQLAHMLRELGADVAMLYMEEVRGELVAAQVAAPLYTVDYPGLPVGRHDDLGEESIIVIPEVWGHCALQLAAHHTVLIWWLSVDNGLLALGRTRCFLDQFRSHPRIFHAYQSFYAKEFLSSLGLNEHDLALSDYVLVRPSRTTQKAQADDRHGPLQICFNPLKGAWLANAFKTENPDLQTIALCGMSPEEISAALHSCHAYIDFGHLPGKDRLPREALKAGTRVFLRQCGDGVHSSDWLLPDDAYFSTEDCFNGTLINLLRDIDLADNPTRWQAARRKVDYERDLFRKESENMIDFFRRHIKLTESKRKVAASIDKTHFYLDELTRAERKLFAIRNSMSWKLTSPIRKAIIGLKSGATHFEE